MSDKVTPTRRAASAAKRKPYKPAGNQFAPGSRSGKTVDEFAASKARRAKVISTTQTLVKPSRTFLPFILAAGLLTLFGQVIKAGPKPVSWTRTIVGSVVLLFFLTLLNEASPQLATAFAILILIRALLIHGPTVFGSLAQ